MINKIRCASIFLGISLTTPAIAVDFVNVAEFPDWFQEAMARETQITTESEFKLANFNIDSKVKGKLALAEQGESYWYYQVDFGASAPMECYVFTTFDGTANSMHNVLELQIDAYAESVEKKVTGKFNYALDAGVIGDTPYFAVDKLYNVGEGAEKLAGVMKSMAARTDESLQVCLHNELGYRQTFKDAFTSFIQAFLQAEQNLELFSTVYSMSFNGIPVGVAREKYSVDKDGDVQLVMDTSLIFPVDQSNFSRSDTYNVEWSGPDGAMINAEIYTVENGALASQFILNNVDEKWTVTGQVQGKDIEEVVTGDGIISSSFGSHLASASLATSEDSSLLIPMWMVDVDPTAAISVKVNRLDDDKDFNRSVEMGPVQMKFNADENGVMKNGVMDQGPLKFDMNLMYSNGKPVLP